MHLVFILATKRYIAENFISKHEKSTLLQQLPIFVAAGTAAERKSSSSRNLSGEV